jgi:hypothetical protein
MIYRGSHAPNRDCVCDPEVDNSVNDSSLAMAGSFIIRKSKTMHDVPYRVNERQAHVEVIANASVSRVT